MFNLMLGSASFIRLDEISRLQSKSKTDVEIVQGLQQRDRKTEDVFYSQCRKYFDIHFQDVFFDKDNKQEIFQTSFIKLWTEINNGKIRVINGNVCRQQKNGDYLKMSCRLTSFLMTFAKNEFREQVRSNKLDTYAEVYDNVDTSAMVDGSQFCDEDIEAHKNRIVDDCIQQISPRCIEILTLFYYQGKSLDEIMAIRSDSNTSKNGLKTAKNKCMNTLREKITAEFQKYNYKV